MSGVIRVSARDQDSGANSRLRYHIGDSNVLQDFGINALSGEIFVRRPLDRERQADYRFLIVATDQGNPPLTSNASVLIQIGDINDNSPNCSTIRPFFLNEQQNLHRQLIGRLDAEDKDAGANGTVTYRLQKFNELFDLKPNGDLFLRRKIPQMKDSYRLAVIAEDQAERPRSVVCQILIKVEKSPSEIVIQEPVDRLIRFDSSCGVGCPLVRLNATNVKRWSLDEKENTSRFFDLSDDGLLKLKMDLDKNGEDELFRTFQSLTIHLFDAYEQQKQLTLNLKRVPRLMDNSSMVVHVSERAAPGQRITGPPSGFKQTKRNESTVFWALSEESDVFEVEPLSGALYLRSRLNYSNNPIYMLRLAKYTTKGTPLNETTVMIDVQNENMAGPHFESSLVKLQVSEATPIGSILAQIEAIDRDEGKNGSLTYKIIGESPFFGIDSTTGEISLLKTLQHHLQPEHYFILEATDQPSDPNERRRSSCVVLIQVEDTNDNAPAFLSSSSMTLLADLLPTNQPVHYFVAKDMDSGEFGRVQYTIVNGNKPPAFVLDQQTGALTVLHRPTQPLVQLTVRASDSDPTMPRFTEQLFSIQIQANEAKWTYFEQPVYDFTLAASTVVGTPLVDFRRPSFESSVQPNFKLLPQTITDFELDSKQGILKTTTDQLQYGTYHLTVHASDPEQKLSDLTTVLIHVPDHRQVGPKITVTTCGEVWVKEGEATSKDVCTVRVKVLDINDNSPQFTAQSPQQVAITNDHQTGMVVAKFEATDKDEGPNRRVVYRLGGDESGAFDINVESGELFLARDTPVFGNSWEIVVVAEDMGLSKVLHAERRVQIAWKKSATKMSKLRELEFLHQNQSIVVAEGQPKGKFVVQIETTAKFMDAPHKVEFQILDGNHGNAFQIDELGVLKTNKELDAEAQLSYSLKIQATMPGGRKTLGHVNVRILNINDNAPMFPHVLSRRIEEDTPVGSLIISISARDSDIDGQVEYALAAPSTYFELQRSTGDLILLRELDFEQQMEHVLSVQAFDGEYSTFSELRIHLIDINDNAPTFTSDLYEFTCLPSLRLPADVGQVAAVDGDSGEIGSVSYKLVDNGDAASLKINEQSGLVTLLHPLHEHEERFITIQAIDHGTPPLSSISTIKLSAVPKMAKEAPQFAQQNFSFMVAEDFPLHLAFGKLAIKNMSGQAIPCRFQIEDTEMAQNFEIDSMGQISLRQPLDFETHQVYKTRVSARNLYSSTNVQTHVALLEIQVVDVNDNKPEFTKQTQSLVVRIDESVQRGNQLAILKVEDSDSGENGHVSFSLLPAGDTPLLAAFSLDSAGVLRFERWHDDLLADLLHTTNLNDSIVRRTLIVKAEDAGVPSSQWSLLKLKVELDVRTWSGTAPFFPLPSYRYFVTEGANNGSRLLRARATNRIGKEMKDEWTYKLINNDEIFKINSTTAEIFLNGQLDYEKYRDYEFTVSVTDKKHRSAVAPVYITVVGVDEFAPVFTRTSYTFQQLKGC
ncbi:Protocadherin-16 [Aphelenchoides bicaudatus]|nr:Protocadherin-16 [Aphelenchoides bicaudatus]